MADISMCSGKKTKENQVTEYVCPKRLDCYRFTAPANPHWQAYMSFPGRIGEDLKFECDYFWDRKGE